MPDRPKYTNRLIHESSPYLQQHAHNPVDWYPWSNEAFDLANTSDKPIFLSIGYSTCHWCHVMEREVFEDEEIAQMMNDTFINIKVDREERPEVDSLYMEFAQSMMAGAAGWPLNMILTPDLKPFYAATYMPATTRQGVIGMRELVPQMEALWNSEERHRVVQQAAQIVEAFAMQEPDQGDDISPPEVVEAAAEIFFKLSDPIYGGITGAPKFPVGYQESFFLRFVKKFRDSRALFCVEKTLDMIQRGGIHDHIGGGFSRYSVDERWVVPHFEKMLYDNAILSFAYLEAWQLTNNKLFREVAESTLRYVTRDMTHEEGGFFSAEDAESEGREGLFYTWTIDEVKEVLGDENAPLFCDFYDITPQGNFEGRSVPNTPIPLEEYAQERHLDPEELRRRLAVQREQLFTAREERPRPSRDDKVICSWNGQMMHSFANAAWAFDNPTYLDVARKNAEFIKENMYAGGKLVRRWREGDSACPACLDDYACLIRGTLSLFEASGESEWLQWSIELAATLERDFKKDDGPFYHTDGSDPRLILRQIRFADGAEPSGNAIHSENLLRLYQITGNDGYLQQAEAIITAVRAQLESYPPGYAYHLLVLQRYFDRDAPTFVIALNDNEDLLDELRPLLYHPFIPHKAVIWRRNSDQTLMEEVPSCRDQVPIDGKTTLYVCREGVCHEPRTQLSDMITEIHAL